jgi:hypothetical protein
LGHSGENEEGFNLEREGLIENEGGGQGSLSQAK